MGVAPPSARLNCIVLRVRNISALRRSVLRSNDFFIVDLHPRHCQAALLLVPSINTMFDVPYEPASRTVDRIAE
jgi:hypothetical protein